VAAVDVTVTLDPEGLLLVTVVAQTTRGTSLVVRASPLGVG
jgi:hypothetical protein